MAVTLAEAKANARAIVAAGDSTRALATFDHLLAAQPLDDDLRLEIAELLGRSSKAQEAGEIYRALSMHLVRAGRPLPALVAAKALGKLGLPFDYLLESIADMYAVGSPALAPFATRPAPIDPSLVIPPAPEEDDGPADSFAFDALVERTSRRALDFTGHPVPQDQVHPIPFLSELDSISLLAVLSSLQVRTMQTGQLVVRQGDPGTSLFLVATGQLRVSTALADGTARELALLHENSLFGEMALVTSQPRGASVAAVDASVVLELDRAALAEVRAEIPSIEVALSRFTRERLIRNLLATSPLFTPFTREQQSSLLQRFEGTEVDAGVTVIRQGEPGQGLHVVLTGDLEVFAESPGAADRIKLGELHPGDVCGEMSLMTDQPTSATVRTLTPCTLLFLSRIYFDRLTEAVPEVKDYFAGIAQRRAADNSSRIDLVGLADVGALPEEVVELDESDAIPL